MMISFSLTNENGARYCEQSSRLDQVPPTIIGAVRPSLLQDRIWGDLHASPEEGILAARYD